MLDDALQHSKGASNLPHQRKPQAGHRIPALEGVTIVSADGHWSVSEDIWYEGFPASMRDQAPRVWRQDNVWQIGPDLNTPMVTQGSPLHPVLSSFDQMPGTYQIEARLKDMDVEGIDKEMVFFGIAVSLLFRGAPEVRTLICRIYNQYIAEVAKKAPGRFNPVAFMPVWDMENADAHMQEIVDLGFKTLFLPQKAIGPDGKQWLYQEDEMAPLWNAIQASRLPACFHIGESLNEGRGAQPTTVLNNMQFRQTFGELVFGGVLDRHPNLKIAFVEANVNWIPGMLQDAAVAYDSFRGITYPIKLSPRDYWARNFWATILTDDPVGLRHIDELGVDKVMYGPDYPHAESTFGNNWTVMESIVNQVGPEKARAILGENAINLFRL